MKKYFTIFCYVALAIAGVSFASCGNDDEIEAPKQEEQKPEEVVQTVSVYTAAFGSDLLDIYDITLSIYRNGKKQDVVLSTANTMKDYDETHDANMYYYYCASVKGEEGVDSVLAAIANKPDIETIIAGKDADHDCNLSCYAVIKKLKKAADDNYYDYCFTPSFSSNHWADLLTENKGVLIYERFREKLEKSFSAK